MARDRELRRGLRMRWFIGLTLPEVVFLPANLLCFPPTQKRTDRSYVGPRGLTSGGFLNHEEKETRR